MGRVETEGNQQTKYIIGPAGDGIAFVEDIIEPGKAASLGHRFPGSILAMVSVEGVAVRKLRDLGGGRYDADSIVDLPPGTSFNVGDGETAIVFNRGSAPIIKRKITVDPQSEYKTE